MLSENDINNDLEKLYESTFKEEEETLNQLRKYSSIVNTRFGLNLRYSEKIIEKTQKKTLRIRQIERLIKMGKFISTQEIKVQFKLNKSILNLNSIINNKKNDDSDEEDNNSPPTFEIINNHKNSNDPNILNINKISDFIKIFTSSEQKLKNLPNPVYNYVIEDISKGEQKHKIYKTLNDYLNIIELEINKSEIFKDESENEKSHIKNGIQNYILQKIYKSVFPKKPLKKDQEFYSKVCQLTWIKPEMLEIKKIYISELKFAEECISRIDEGKTVYDKLKSIADAHNTINTTIKFSTGKNDDAGADDLSPIFQYIIIKAKPKRFYSNLYYIKCFLGSNQITGINGFLLTQLEFAGEFINKIDHIKLKMSKNDFDDNIRNSKMYKHKNSINSINSG